MKKTTVALTILAFFGLMGTAAIFGFMFGAGLDAKVNEDVHTIEQQVAMDAVAQYRIVARRAEKTDDYLETCVYAGLVVASFTQAKDEEHYKKWKDEEQRVCSLNEALMKIKMLH